MTKHDKAHYAIAALLLVLICGALWGERILEARRSVSIVHQSGGGFGFAETTVPKKLRPGEWPALGQDKTIAIGDGLQVLGPTKVTIFCPSPLCTVLEADLDDAMQIAGWSDEEESQVLANDDAGIMVGPPGPKADALAKALQDAGLGPVTIVPMHVGGDLGIIIGKRPKP